MWIFELFLKSKAVVGFGIGFSVSKSCQGTNFQPYWIEIVPNYNILRLSGNRAPLKGLYKTLTRSL